MKAFLERIAFEVMNAYPTMIDWIVAHPHKTFWGGVLAVLIAWSL
jgi:hypothetical protein